MKRSTGKILFDTFNYAFFVFFCVTIIVPFINVLAISLSSQEATIGSYVGLLPKGLTFDAYLKVLTNSLFFRTFLNTLGLTIVNTILQISLSLLAGYVLASRHFIFAKPVWIFILISMYFSGGLIPSYLLVNNWLGLSNSYLALILPGMVNTFYIIIFRNLIHGLPQEMIESAEIDGANQRQTLAKVITPLVKPTIAAFVVFSSVQNWSTWFDVMLYMRDDHKWTLQYLLRQVLVTATLTETALERLPINAATVYSEGLKMAMLIVTILPILVVYPFVQKYFIKGVLVGAVKG